jgi:RluA family pseudouridine synthase
MTMTTKLKLPTWRDMVLYHDADYTIINKPAYLSTLEDRSSPMNVLKLARDENPMASPAHRLDKETSGVLVIANHDEAYKHFAGLLEKRQVKKVYHAVADGIHQFDNLEAHEPLLSTGSKTRVDFKEGKPSLTLAQTLETFKKHTLVKCFPVTGRMHQIRVHLAWHKAPITGDELYGGAPAYLSGLKKNFNQNRTGEEQPMMRRLALHAHSVTFLKLSGQECHIEAPYPKDFGVLVEQMRKFS